MKCPKCGFVGFDHLSTCAKCGKELDSVRRDLNLFDFAPAVPAFVLEAVLALTQRSVGASAAAAAVSVAAGEPGGSLDLLGEIDLKVDVDEKPEEITLELLDEGEDASAVLEPTVETPSENFTLGGPSATAAEWEEKPVPLETEPDDLDLKIDADLDKTQEPGVFDLSDVEDETAFVETLDEEAMTDEALERLRRELESAGGILKEIEKGEPSGDEAHSPTAVVLEPEPSEEAVEIEEDAGISDLGFGHAPVEKEEKDEKEKDVFFAVVEPDGSVERKLESDDKEEDVFILMEEREGGLAVQEFSLEESPSGEEKRGEGHDETLVLDLDALTDEGELKPETEKASKGVEPEIDALVLELEDGFYIEPDDKEER